MWSLIDLHSSWDSTALGSSRVHWSLHQPPPLSGRTHPQPYRTILGRGKSLRLKVKVYGSVKLPLHPQPAPEDRSFRGFFRSPTPGATPSGVPRVEGFTNPRLVGEHPAYRGPVRLHQPPIVCTAPIEHPPLLQPLEPMLSIGETPRQLSRQLMHEIPHPVPLPFN